MNGIATHIQHMTEGQEEISQLFGEPVQYCYNPTSQSHFEDVIGLFGDLTQAGTQKLGRITDEVNSLVAHLREALAEVGKNGCVVHIAHSQGALITSLAAKLLKPEEMNQIEVIALGGAAAIRRTPQFPFRRCINYYSVNDPLIWVAPTAAQSLRSGRVVGDPDEEFCFLAPRAGDPVEDHALLGPTYLQALKWEAARFRVEHRSLAFKLVHPLYVTAVCILQILDFRVRQLIKLLLSCLIHAGVSFIRGFKTKRDQSVSILRDWIIRLVIFPIMEVVDSLQELSGDEKYEVVSEKDIISKPDTQ